MTICLIGGTGFLGRHICELMQRRSIGGTVVSRKPDLEFLKSHAPSLRAASIESSDLDKIFRQSRTLIYLASSSRPGLNWHRADMDIQDNVLTATRLVQSAVEANPTLSVIFASSGGTIYGGGHTSPISEEAPEKPITGYGLGKLLTERSLEFISRLNGNALTILRIANPVGVWQVERSHGFVSLAIDSAVRGRELTLYGQGQNLRDYIDADELAELFLQIGMSDAPRPGVYNVGSGSGFSEKDVLAIVEDVVGKEIAVKNLPARPFDLSYAVMNPQKVCHDFGWKSRATLTEIVARLLTAKRD